jgi:hypothetical protein
MKRFLQSYFSKSFYCISDFTFLLYKMNFMCHMAKISHTYGKTNLGFFLFFFFYSATDRTLGLAHARQALCCWTQSKIGFLNVQYWKLLHRLDVGVPKSCYLLSYCCFLASQKDLLCFCNLCFAIKGLTNGCIALENQTRKIQNFCIIISTSTDRNLFSFYQTS